MSNNITNLAKPTFEKIKKGTESSDYLKNKKSKLIYCNGGKCGRLNKSTSYNERILYNNGKLINDNGDGLTINPNHKYDLVNNLFSTMDLNGAYVITDVSNNDPTCIDISLIPFYGNYNIDPDDSLFGDSSCSANNFVNYMTTNLDYVAPTTVLYNRTSQL